MRFCYAMLSKSVRGSVVMFALLEMFLLPALRQGNAGDMYAFSSI